MSFPNNPDMPKEDEKLQRLSLCHKLQESLTMLRMMEKHIKVDLREGVEDLNFFLENRDASIRAGGFEVLREKAMRLGDMVDMRNKVYLLALEDNMDLKLIYDVESEESDEEEDYEEPEESDDNN